MKLTRVNSQDISERASEIETTLKAPKSQNVRVEFLNSGCTMINLACSGTRYGAFPRGRITNIVGDGSSGKSLIANETAFYFIKDIKNTKSKLFPPVKNPIVVFNNGEAVMDFPLEEMYGKKYVDSIEWTRSKTIEGVGRDYIERLSKLKKGDSLFYIIDSWDSFKSVHDAKILKEKDEEIVKGYALKKQQYAWAFFAEVCEYIDKNNADATLFVISQTKAKIGVMFGKKKYRTGGDALNFYTHLVPWIREVKKDTKTIKGDERVYSINGEIKVERSKVALPFRKSNFKIVLDYGIDDIASCGEYLKTKKITNWRGISLDKIENFAREVEKQGLQERLQIKVERLWKDVEEDFKNINAGRIKRRL